LDLTQEKVNLYIRLQINSKYLGRQFDIWPNISGLCYSRHCSSGRVQSMHR
jgi:hypothetical protein